MVNKLLGLFTEQVDSCVHTCTHALRFCQATLQGNSTIPVNDGCKIQRGNFAIANSSTLRGLFFLSVMGIPPHCISFKRNFYKEDLLQVRECTQVPTIDTNVFAVSFAYTTFVVRLWTSQLLHGVVMEHSFISPRQYGHSVRRLMRLRCFFAQIERLRRADAFPVRLGNR